jgi:hypothetical protein
MLSRLYVPPPDRLVLRVPGLRFSDALGVHASAESRLPAPKLLLLWVPGLLKSAEYFDPARASVGQHETDNRAASRPIALKDIHLRKAMVRGTAMPLGTPLGGRLARLNDAHISFEDRLADPLRILDCHHRAVESHHPETARGAHHDDFISNLQHTKLRQMRHNTRGPAAEQKVRVTFVVASAGVW